MCGIRTALTVRILFAVFSRIFCSRSPRKLQLVVSLCNESDRTIEVDLTRARRAEVFVAAKASEGDAKKCMEDAFLMA